VIFWPHGNDLEAPPEISDLRYRRPQSDYWESPAGDKETALVGFWKRWTRETGKPLPRKLPTVASQARTSMINRTTGSRRPSHYAEKNVQDRNV
jgi:hypothetical protein